MHINEHLNTESILPARIFPPQNALRELSVMHSSGRCSFTKSYTTHTDFTCNYSCKQHNLKPLKFEKLDNELQVFQVPGNIMPCNSPQYDDSLWNSVYDLWDRVWIQYCIGIVGQRWAFMTFCKRTETLVGLANYALYCIVHCIVSTSLWRSQGWPDSHGFHIFQSLLQRAVFKKSYFSYCISEMARLIEYSSSECLLIVNQEGRIPNQQLAREKLKAHLQVRSTKASRPGPGQRKGYCGNSCRTFEWWDMSQHTVNQTLMHTRLYIDPVRSNHSDPCAPSKIACNEQSGIRTGPRSYGRRLPGPMRTFTLTL